MKYLVLLFFFASCSSFATKESTIEVSKVLECLDTQVEIYGDLCGEEDTDGEQAHYNGVKCAVQYAKWCMGLE